MRTIAIFTLFFSFFTIIYCFYIHTFVQRSFSIVKNKFPMFQTVAQACSCYFCWHQMFKLSNLLNNRFMSSSCVLSRNIGNKDISSRLHDLLFNMPNQEEVQLKDVRKMRMEKSWKRTKRFLVQPTNICWQVNLNKRMSERQTSSSSSRSWAMAAMEAPPPSSSTLTTGSISSTVVRAQRG